LSFAALTAAIVASLAGKANSISTIFTLDIYKKFFNREASEANQVRVGRIAIIVALIIGAMVAPVLRNFAQAFQFIQNFTGLISPGITAIFLLGFFWRNTTATAALLGAIVTIPAGILLEQWLPGLPFMHRMGWVFVIVAGLMVLVSLLDKKGRENVRAIQVETSDFKTAPAFTIGMVVVVVILGVLYSIFW
jgi:SSS family solute:Na+ symporter